MKRLTIAALLLAASVTLLGGCSVGSGGEATTGPSPTETQPPDPYKGWVPKFDFDSSTRFTQVWYRCDKRNTGYYVAWSNEGGVTVVPNSPDCVPQ